MDLMLAAGVWRVSPLSSSVCEQILVEDVDLGHGFDGREDGKTEDAVVVGASVLWGVVSSFPSLTKLFIQLMDEKSFHPCPPQTPVLHCAML